MSNFHGYNQQNGFFEGWYLKHQNAGKSLALIPAYHIDETGKASASIQAITDDSSHSISFSEEDFLASENQFFVKIGNNLFSESGICKSWIFIRSLLADLWIWGIDLNFYAARHNKKTPTLGEIEYYAIACICFNHCDYDYN